MEAAGIVCPNTVNPQVLVRIQAGEPDRERVGA